ncbi:hypothetical protein [Telluribacter humicola]|uniref:hypothetical protein n=1 Tax=Telluribacter humicola TaxID=1720261 RepID=UPI001A96FEC6|nr:hypothetical protein [Telluribacter humicola]
MKNSHYPFYLEFPDVASKVRRHLTEQFKKQFGPYFAGTTPDGKIWFSFDSPKQLEGFHVSTHLLYRGMLGLQTIDESVSAETVGFSRVGFKWEVYDKKK